LTEEQIAAELDNALQALERLALDCSTGTLTGTFVKESLEKVRDHLLEVLPNRSPATAYIKQASLWPNTVWSDSYGYVSPQSCDPINVWIKTTRKALDAVSPGFTRPELGARDAYFSPGERFEALRHVLGILRRASVSVRMVNRYMDEIDLDFAESVDDKITVQLLTEFPVKAFPHLYHAMQSRRGTVEARKGTGFHGRYVAIDGREAWILDASLKDIAEKGTSIHRVPDPDLQKTLDDIEAWWVGASPI